jgi:hypothetical protein
MQRHKPLRTQHSCPAFNLQGGQQRGWTFCAMASEVAIKVSGNLDCNDGELFSWIETQGPGHRLSLEKSSELSTGGWSRCR